MNKCLVITDEYRALWEEYQGSKLHEIYPSQEDFQALVQTWMSHYRVDVYPSLRALEDYTIDNYHREQADKFMKHNPIASYKVFIAKNGLSPREFNEIKNLFLDHAINNNIAVDRAIQNAIIAGKMLAGTSKLDDRVYKLVFGKYVRQVLSPDEYEKLLDEAEEKGFSTVASYLLDEKAKGNPMRELFARRHTLLRKIVKNDQADALSRAVQGALLVTGEEGERRRQQQALNLHAFDTLAWKTSKGKPVNVEDLYNANDFIEAVREMYADNPAIELFDEIFKKKNLHLLDHVKIRFSRDKDFIDDKHPALLEEIDGQQVLSVAPAGTPLYRIMPALINALTNRYLYENQNEESVKDLLNIWQRARGMGVSKDILGDKLSVFVGKILSGDVELVDALKKMPFNREDANEKYRHRYNKTLLQRFFEIINKLWKKLLGDNANYAAHALTLSVIITNNASEYNLKMARKAARKKNAAGQFLDEETAVGAPVITNPSPYARAYEELKKLFGPRDVNDIKDTIVASTVEIVDKFQEAHPYVDRSFFWGQNPFKENVIDPIFDNLLKITIGKLFRGSLHPGTDGLVKRAYVKYFNMTPEELREEAVRGFRYEDMLFMAAKTKKDKAFEEEYGMKPNKDLEYTREQFMGDMLDAMGDLQDEMEEDGSLTDELEQKISDISMTILNVSALSRNRESAWIFASKHVGRIEDVEFEIEKEEIKTRKKDEEEKENKEEREEQEEEGDREDEGKEGWMIDYRKRSVHDSMSTLVKRSISTIDALDPEGKVIMNSFGFPRKMDIFEVKNFLLDELQNLLYPEQLQDALFELAARVPSLGGLAEKIAGDPVLATQFYVVFSRNKQRFDQTYVKESIGASQFNTSEIERSLADLTQRVITRAENPGYFYDKKGMMSPVFVDTIEYLQERAREWLLDLKNAREQPDPEAAASEVMARMLDSRDQNNIVALLEKMAILVSPRDIWELRRRAGTTKVYDLLVEMIGLTREMVASSMKDKKAVEYFQVLKNKNYKSIYAILSRGMPQVVEASFRDDNSIISAYLNSSYASNMAKRLGNASEFSETEYRQYLDNEFGGEENPTTYTRRSDREGEGLYRIPWLEYLREHNGRSKENTPLINFKANYFYANKRYDNFGEIGMINSRIAHFFSIDGPWYALPVPADAEVLEMIHFPGIRHASTDDVIKDMYGMFLYEMDRVKIVNERLRQLPDRTIANMDGKRGQSYLHFPWMETTRDKATIMKAYRDNDHETLKKLFETNQKAYMEQLFARFLENLERLGIYSSKTRITTRRYRGRIREWTSYEGDRYFGEDASINTRQLKKMDLEEFYYNNYLAQLNMHHLFINDLALYKNNVDADKRVKELHAPGTRLNTSATYVDPTGTEIRLGKETERFITLDDEYVSSSDTMKANVHRALAEAAGLSKEEKAFLESKLSGMHLTTDGETYRTLESARSLIAMTTGWNHQLEDAYQRLKKGEYDRKDYKTILKAVKPYIFTNVLVDTGMLDSQGRPVKTRVGYQRKNMEIILIPAMYKALNSPRLEGIYKAALKHHVDTIVFKSAEKTGAIGVIPMPKPLPGQDERQLFEDLIEANKDKIREISYHDYKIQVSIPDHSLDGKILVGSQARLHVFANIADEEVIEFKKKRYSGGEIKQMYHEMLTDNIIEDSARVLDELSDMDNLKKILEKEIHDNNKYSSDLLNALYIEEIPDEETGIPTRRFAMPLDSSNARHDTMALLQSIFKKRVNKQMIPGFGAEQVSDFGLSDRLKVNFVEMTNSKGERQLVPGEVEIMIPLPTDKEIKGIEDLMKENNGHVTPKMLIERGLITPDILEGIAYRIPTEGKYFMLPVKIVGFLPRNTGVTVMGPPELLVMMGIDFDGDKLYIMMKHKNVTNGTLHAVQYDPSVPSPALTRRERDNKILDLMRAILISPVAAGERVNINNTEQLATQAYRIKLMQMHQGDVPGFSRKEILAMSLDELKKHALAEQTDWFDIITQVNFYKDNVTSAILVPIFANAASSYVKIQGVDLRALGPRFALDGKYAVQTTEKSVIGRVSNPLDADNILKTTRIGRYLSAAVDAIKDPILAYMNVNKHTANVAAMLVMFGYSDEAIALFLSQPHVTGIVEKVNNESINLGPTYIEAIAKGLERELKIDARKQGIWDLNKVLSPKERHDTDVLALDVLAGDIQYEAQRKNDLAYRVRQLHVLRTFGEMMEVAGRLFNIFSVLAVDKVSRAPGGSANRTLTFKRALEKVNALQAAALPTFIHEELLFPVSTTALVSVLKGETPDGSEENNIIPLQDENQKTNITSILTKEGDIDYEQLTAAADAIENGALYLNGLSLEETTGSLRGGRTHVEASLLAAADERASGKEQATTGEDAIKRIAASQEEVLEMYAREKDKWIPASEIEKWVLLDYGMESKAYKDPNDDTYILKVMHNYKIFSKTPLEFLDNRITLHNYIFPDAAYELIGFSKVKGDRYEDPTPRLAFIVRQQYVPGREITEADRPLLDQEMIKYGFQRIEGTDSYANSDYRVGDLHVRNVMITDGGNFRFIDTVSILNTPGLGLGGTREYGPHDLVPTRETHLPLLTDNIITNNNINYGQLRKAADAIERNEAHLDRLSPAEERGRATGGRTNVEASLLLAAKERADSQEGRDARQRTDNERAKVQEQLLKQYARRTGTWITPEEIDSWEYLTSGMEARVYEDPKDPDYLLKVVYNYKNFTPTPLEYLDNRISLYNHLFGTSGSGIELVGFTETYGATRDVKGPFFAFVIRQRHIQGRELEEGEVHLLDEEMKKRGFDKRGDVYYNDDYIIEDLHADNAIIDNDGNIFFIDPSVALNTPDEDFDGTREYGNNELPLIAPPTKQDLLKQLLREQLPHYNTGFVNAYYNAGVQANMALMSLYFKDYGRFFEFLANLMTGNYIVQNNMPDKLFDHLVDEYAMYYLSRFPFFNRANAQEFLENFYLDLQDQLNASPYLAGLELFKYIRVEGKRVVATGLSYIDAQVKEKLTLDWEQLYTGEHQQLAVDLYRYAYFISGNNMSIETFYHLLPVYIKIHHVVDENGGTLANIEHNMFDDETFSVVRNKDEYDSKIMKQGFRFLQQFVMNNTSNDDLFSDVRVETTVGTRLANINDETPHPLLFNINERGARNISRKRYIRVIADSEKIYFRVLGKEDGVMERHIEGSILYLVVQRVSPRSIDKFHVYDYFDREEMPAIVETIEEEDIADTREAIIDYLSASLNPAARDFRDNLNELIMEAREQRDNPSDEHLEKIEQFFNTAGPLIRKDIHDILARAGIVDETNAIDVLRPIYTMTGRRRAMPVDESLLQEIEQRSKTLASQLVIRTFSPEPVDARVMFAAFTSLHEHTNELLNAPDPTAYAREKENLARALEVNNSVVDKILLEYKDIERSKEKCK